MKKNDAFKSDDLLNRRTDAFNFPHISKIQKVMLLSNKTECKNRCTLGARYEKMIWKTVLTKMAKHTEHFHEP